MNHLEQAKHNSDVLLFLIKNKPNDFFDWKITITFYIAHHLLKEFAKLEKKFLPPDHSEMLRNLNPKTTGGTLPLDQIIYDSYLDLYQTSRTVRYNELYEDSNITFVNLKKYSFGICTDNLNSIKDFLKSKYNSHFSVL